MRSARHALIAAICATMTATTIPAPAQIHAHEAHEVSPGVGLQLTLDHGRKWATDAALRHGMTAIRAAVARDRPAIHRGTQTAEQYAALAATITDQVAYIVKHCRLEPAADAQLHRVIGELVAGAEIMRGTQADAAPAEGAARSVRALDVYGRYFVHPGWKALAQTQ
jgi:hypothetical protein